MVFELGNEILIIYQTIWNNFSIVTKMGELCEVCDVCGKDFQNRRTFTSHLKTHEDREYTRPTSSSPMYPR